MSQAPEAGQTVDLYIERLTYGGEGLGHLADGRVCFARGVVAGDTVELRLDQVKKNHARGTVLSVISPSPDTVDPFCEHVDACGGCPWQRTALADQRAALDAHVKRCLSRSVPDVEAVAKPLVAATPTEGWRSTARFHWRDGQIGYQVPRSHDILEVERCPALSPALAGVHAALREHMASFLRNEGVARIAVGPDGTSGTIALEGKRPLTKAAWKAAEAMIESDPRVHGVSGRFTHEWRHLGEPFNAAGPARTAHPANSFMQAHQPGTAALVEAVVAMVPPKSRVLELYAGSGNFSVPLAQAGCRVTTVEVDQAAVDALNKTAESLNLWEHLKARRGQANRLPGGRFDVALIDPPRAGARPTLAALDKLPLKRLIYVSCDPATLARDVAILVGLGWRVESLQTFDLFPHTGHVESLVSLVR